MDAEALVFVVDDDASLRASLQDLLESVGLRVAACASAQEFLRSTRPEVPSCLVLDVRLPGLSGLELQQRLAEADLAMPIIFMTGHGDIPMTVPAMQAGAVEFLTHVERSDCGVEGCLAYLRRGGTDWSPPPARDAVRREDDRSWFLVGSRHIEALIDLPLRSDPGGRDRAGFTRGLVSTFCLA